MGGGEEEGAEAVGTVCVFEVRLRSDLVCMLHRLVVSYFLHSLPCLGAFFPFR